MRATSHRSRPLLLTVTIACVVLGACEDDDPAETPPANNSNNQNNQNNSNNQNNTDACATVCADLAGCGEIASLCQAQVASSFETECMSACDGGVESLAGFAAVGCSSGVAPAADRLGLTPMCTNCTPDPEAYSPGAADSWDACISDDNTYHRILPDISSIGRIAGFEMIADLLWRSGTPTSDDFLAARDIYATGEGLDSRVQRREDEHYPPVSDGAGGTLRCRDEGVPAMDPDRCVGPALILPILNDAFAAGAQGEEPLVNAAKIEAALLWFAYVSSHKEATTCTTTAKDCDSAYAYYTGGVPRDQGLGLAGYIRRISPPTHDDVWDGILAVRCWRDLDPGEEATDLEMRDQAIGQLDRALLYGVARIVADRMGQMSNHTGEQLEADMAFVTILGNVLLREANERDPSAAAVLETEVNRSDPNDLDATAALDALTSTFACSR